jgi:hypothetical protein
MQNRTPKEFPLALINLRLDSQLWKEIFLASPAFIVTHKRDVH